MQPHQTHRTRTLILCGVLLAIVLLACDWPPREMYLSEKTADAVMAYIRYCDPNADFADEWTVSCWALEGIICEVVEPEIAEPNLGELTSNIVGEIGGQYVEHAVDNTVTVHCVKRHNLPNPGWQCQINRGGDWEDLPVR